MVEGVRAVHAPKAEGVGAVPAPTVIVVREIPTSMIKGVGNVHAAMERVRLQMVRAWEDFP
jgi:hypothetical protein